MEIAQRRVSSSRKRSGDKQGLGQFLPPWKVAVQNMADVFVRVQKAFVTCRRSAYARRYCNVQVSGIKGLA